MPVAPAGTVAGTATTSIVPALKAALVTALTSALTGVQVVYGRPQDNLIVGREIAYIADFRGAHRIPVMKAGRKTREETGTVDVVFSVMPARGALTDAEARAFDLLDALENTLANDPGLTALDGLVFATLGDIDVTSQMVKEGPLCIIVAGVDIHARLN